ncbi:MAG: response regulator [Kiloniellales bacterium]|nr:response regulator [Kiloniellales bacterium]
MTESELNVLLVEDDDVEAEAVTRSFKKHGLPFPVVVAGDGMEALGVLRGERPEIKIEKPYVVLLDLNMPRMNGFEFLQELRADDLLSNSVVFVLTTSDSDVDKSRAYQDHVAGYMVKASVGPQFMKLAQLLKDYRDAVELP